MEGLPELREAEVIIVDESFVELMSQAVLILQRTVDVAQPPRLLPPKRVHQIFAHSNAA